MIKNAIYRVDNGSDFDEIHFKTNPNQVVFDDGETFQQKLDSGTLKGEQVYVNVEGSHISTDSSVGYAKDIEILGNTIQDASNLADIRSVGDTVEGQELYEIPVVSVGKNLLKDSLIRDFTKYTFNETYKSIGIKVEKGKSYIASLKLIDSFSPNDIANTYFSISDYCNPASPTQPEYHHLINGIKYIPQTTPITSKDGYIYLCVFNQTGNTKDIFDKLMKNIEYIQLEEGTQATPYEPYVEDKLTILSPVQLEKVGDVADRIIEKDGVWGVEKNIDTVILDGSDDFGYYLASSQPVDTTLINIYVSKALPKASSSSSIISNRFTNNSETEAGNCYRGGSNNVHFILSKAIIGNVTMFKSWLRENLTTIMYELAQPQFIPLPHDQQIKLRTFAGQTNIHFETEIEGTIKAQVPKSIGATVNTHTEQIGNLSKELDRVKKLEESTVSTVTTESDFTNVEETANGYFEDVKIEGKTLVNLADKAQYRDTIEGWKTTLGNVELYKPNTTYTFIGNVTTLADGVTLTIGSASLKKGHNIVTFRTKDTVSSITLYSVGSPGSFVVDNVIILEGDHTQNPPSYFEGLKSVGDGVDEVSVESVNGDKTQSNKKPLLYYNNETQTWEKPILRQWDSIEKHADGKYYYHQRSGEVVLNGSERWITDPASANMINMWISCENIKAKTIMLCDKFNYEPAFSYGKDKECISNVTNNVINLALAKSRLVTQDAQGFKQWLQNNNVTVVYQLAQEKVYECTNIDLITYANETNFIIESGAIAPRTTLKVHSNISNVVSLLQKKVSLLESNVKASQEVQDMMILETDMRMLDIELALMEFIPMKLNLGGSDMLRSATYFNFLKNHIINETYEKEYLENVMNKYLATGRINQDEYNELYKMLYPPVYDIELPIEY